MLTFFISMQGRPVFYVLCASIKRERKPIISISSPHFKLVGIYMMNEEDGQSDDDVPENRKSNEAAKIDHTYTDYSVLNNADDVAAAIAGGVDADVKKGPTPNFPSKLHEIVSNSDYEHIIRWMPHGRAWKVLNKQLLASVVCPYHFSHSSFDSFNRQVNGWGFKVCMKICFFLGLISNSARKKFC